LRNEITSSKEGGKRPPLTLRHNKSRGERQQSNALNSEKRPGKNSIEERNKACGDRLGGGKQIKTKGVGKGGWQTVKSDRQGRSVAWAGIAGQALFPGETPMGALCAGQDGLRGQGDG
jgi:hypothetical protein